MKKLLEKALTVLLIEDNSADAFLTQEILKDSMVPNVVHVAKDGVKALGHMLGKDGESGMHMPDLILLDLNLPIMDGFGFLVERKKYRRLKDIPVFILSASSADVDIEKARNLGVRGYFVKPLDLDEFEKELGQAFRGEEQE